VIREILQKYGNRVLTVATQWQYIFGFRKMRGVTWLTDC